MMLIDLRRETNLLQYVSVQKIGQQSINYHQLSTVLNKWDLITQNNTIKLINHQKRLLRVYGTSENIQYQDEDVTLLQGRQSVEDLSRVQRHISCIYLYQVIFQDRKMFNATNFWIYPKGNTNNHTINIIKLSIYIQQSSEELPHYKLRSISEYDLFLSRLRQKKLDKLFSKSIEQKAMMKIYTKVRSEAYKLLLKTLFFKKQTAIDTKIEIEQIKTGIINVIRRSENPIPVYSELY
ncbi:hypothetical protein ABPG73_022674 [Tetrahymena malaccensis]